MSKRNNEKLLKAADEGDLKIVLKLLKPRVKVDLNATEEYGNTALMLAAIAGHSESYTEIVRALIDAGADLEITDEDEENEYGRTALIWAGANGNTEIAAVLIEAGADQLAMDIEGNTALMCAQRDLRRECAAFLKKAQLERNKGWSSDGKSQATYTEYDDESNQGLRYIFDFVANIVLVVPLNKKLQALKQVETVPFSDFRDAAVHLEKYTRCYDPELLVEAKQQLSMG